MSENSRKGRPKGSPNNTTKEFRSELIKNLKGEYSNLGKYIKGGTDPGTRLKYLLRFGKIILPKGVPLSKEGEEIREIIYQQLKDEYSKLKYYLSHVSTTEKSKTVIELTKLLTPQQQGGLFK